ncbi:MAG: phosphate acetyltransferase, partial [Lachnospiraceae bacterium]|nr:phosphate acetyltransferase [Lachnospiraceae bacterium]
MSFIDDIKARARKNIKTIVLPEAEDRRVLEAAATTLKEGN